MLGNGAAADELRRQAAEAGAELAQRFSARVTHVVTEPGLGADDPRVAKALAADLPVLGVDECVQLLGFCEVPGAAALIPPQPVEAPKKRATVKAKGAKGAVKAGSGGDQTAGPAPASSPEAEAGAWSEDETGAKAELGLLAGTESAMESAAVLARGVESDSEQAGLAGTERTELGEGGAASETEIAVREPLSVVDVREVAAEELLSAADMLEVVASRPLSEVGPLEGTGAGALGQVEPLQGVTDEHEPATHADFNSLTSEDHALSGMAKVSEGSSAYSPMESMLGSALEAALLFPPLPVSASESLTLDSDYLIDSYPDAPAITESEQPVDRIRSAGLVGWAEQAGQVEQSGRLGRAGRIADVVEATEVTEVTETTAVGLAEAGGTSTSTGIGIGIGIGADPKRNGDSASTSDSDSDSMSTSTKAMTRTSDATRNSNEDHTTPEQPTPAPHAGLTTNTETLETPPTTATDDPPPAPDTPNNPTTPDPTGARARAVASYAWAAIPFASLGLLTPVAMGYAAYRQRSRSLGAVAAWYLFAVTIAFAISATATDGTRTQSSVGDLLTICLAASWIGGTVHALLIRRQVFGRSE